MIEHQSTYHLDETQLEAEARQIEAAKKDPKAFAVLYDKYYLRIFRYILQRVADEVKAAEITSDTFAKALNKLPSFTYQGVPFSAWLFRVAHNELLQSYRKKKAEKVVNIKDEHLELLQQTDDETTEERTYQMEQLVVALRDLPPAELELIEMRFFEQRSFREIGEILEITENNAKVRTFRTVKKLRKLLA